MSQPADATTRSAADVPVQSNAEDTAGSDERAGEPAAAVAPAAVAADRGAGRWVVVAVVVGYLLQVAWRIWLGRDLSVPAAHADEDGYLVAARTLTGGAGGATTDNDLFRRLGYPMVISPIYWFTNDAFTVYRAVLVVNAVVNALVFPLMWLFAHRVLDLPVRTALGGAFVAAAMPAVVFYSHFALTDAILATVVLGWLMLAHRWLVAQTAHGRMLAAIGTGAAAGFVFVVHVRGTVIVFVHGLLVLALLALRRSTWPSAIAAIGASVVMMGLDPLLKLLSGDAIQSRGRSPKRHTFEGFTTLSGIERTLGTADGQLWYLSIATLGLGAIGLVAAIRPLLRRAALRNELADREAGARRIIVTTVLAATLFICVSSSAALPPGDQRVNYFAYPRYIHMLFPAWLLIGLAALLAARTLKQAAVLTAIGAGITGVTGAIVWLRVHSLPPRTFLFLFFDSPEASFLGRRWDAIGVVRPTAVALVLLAGIFVLIRRPQWLLIRRARLGLAVALLGIGALVAANMVVATEKVNAGMGAPVQYPPGVPKIVRDGLVRPGDTIAYTTRQPVWYLQYNHMREVYWTSLILFDPAKDPVPAEANVVIAPYQIDTTRVKHWDGTRHGFRLAHAVPAQQWAIWRR